MKLYRIEFGFDEGGDSKIGVAWAGTQAEAKAKHKDLMEGDNYDIETTPVEIPTDKPGLLDWLNRNVVGDLLT